MTPRMKNFLCRAAKAARGKGVMVERHDSRIASKACNDGYGMMINGGFGWIFILDDEARESLRPGGGYKPPEKIDLPPMGADQ